jgi:hypothetical protein
VAARAIILRAELEPQTKVLMVEQVHHKEDLAVAEQVQ